MLLGCSQKSLPGARDSLFELLESVYNIADIFSVYDKISAIEKMDDWKLEDEILTRLRKWTVARTPSSKSSNDISFP
jgi:hypothetical protein